MSTDQQEALASDAALARRAALRDSEAFEELFGRHFASTFRYARHMLDGDDDLAEETVQEAWIKAWRGLPGFAGRSRFRTWVFSIVAREVVNVRRRRRPLVIDDTALARMSEEAASSHGGTPDTSSAETTVEHGELWVALSLALAELPWRQRASWVLREFEHMSYDEIARVLETTPGVVRGQLHRARRSLALRMEEWR